MCNECTKKDFNLADGVLIQRINKGYYHCLTSPARVFINNSGKVDKDWYIGGMRVRVSSKEELEKSLEYREWKIKAFK
jgi:hypothetical protein